MGAGKLDVEGWLELARESRSYITKARTRAVGPRGMCQGEKGYALLAPTRSKREDRKGCWGVWRMTIPLTEQEAQRTRGGQAALCWLL